MTAQRKVGDLWINQGVPWLGIALALDVLGLLLAAASGRLRLVAMGAAAFAAFMAIAAVWLNRPLWRGQGDQGSAGPAGAALAANSRLVGLTYLWGALAMQSLYVTPLTGLKWQHAWQYALAMLILSACSFAYARRLALGALAERERLAVLAVPLAIMQGFFAAAGAAVLVISGKVLAWRSDWAANQIFLFGALLIAVLAAVTLRTHAKLARDG